MADPAEVTLGDIIADHPQGVDALIASMLERIGWCYPTEADVLRDAIRLRVTLAERASGRRVQFKF